MLFNLLKSMIRKSIIENCFQEIDFCLGLWLNPFKRGGEIDP
ncbi:hypothetical protein NEOC65_000520 [Neochlamydia sp. AcF65]|nr:hypothetical protein [Neochlamydia sp. AcF65]MBS4170166.1 hypothetical protein [Neochlamydia sp. AcF95]